MSGRKLIEEWKPFPQEAGGTHTKILTLAGPGHPIRAHRDGRGRLWCFGRDACRCMGLADPQAALACLTDDETGVVTTAQPDAEGRTGHVVVNLVGLNQLLMISPPEHARVFRRWLARTLTELQHTHPNGNA
jgi:prophage antirepressor-like protein